MALVVKIGADMRAFDREMRKLTRDVRTVGGKFQEVGAKMTAAFTAPAIAVATASIKIGMDFEAAMSKVQALSGATGDELAALEKQARELGKTTVFSASEAAEGMAFLAMAGYDTNQIMSAMPGLLDLAAAGQLELGAAADITTNIMSGFNLEAEKTGQVADVLAKAAASANTSVEQMGDAMSYVGPVAAGAGWSLEETAAAIGVLSNAGIQGQRAGTALRGVIAALQNPTGQTAKALKALGLSADDVNPSVHSLSDILKTLEEAGLDSATAMQLVGRESGPALIAMMNVGSEGLSQFTTELENSEGAAKEMATTMMDNLRGSIEEMKSAFEEVALTIYDRIKPALEVITDGLRSLAEWFNNLPEPIQNLILAIGAFLAVLGPLFLIIGTGIILFGQLQATLTILGTSFLGLLGPVALVVGAILGIIAVFTLFGDEVKAFWNKYFKPVVDQIISIVVDALEPAFDSAFSAIKTIVKDAFEIIERLWHEILEPVLKFIIWLVQNFVLPKWRFVFTAIGSVVSDVFKGIKHVWENVLKPILNGIISFVNGVFSGNWRKAWQGIVDIFSGVFNGIVAIAKAPINAIITGINAFIRGLNKIKIPDWVPGVGGKGINIPTIPHLAKGGTIFGSGVAIVGEAGPELLQKSGSTVKVTPLSAQERNEGFSGVLNSRSQTERPIILNIDGKTFAEIVGPYIDVVSGKNVKLVERGLTP